MEPTHVPDKSAGCPATPWEERLIKLILGNSHRSDRKGGRSPREEVQADNEFLPRHLGLGWPSTLSCVLAGSTEKNAKYNKLRNYRFLFCRLGLN